jgi:hypothetical protein
VEIIKFEKSVQMRTAILVLASFTLFFMSCKKESNKKYCWQMTDNIGNDLNVICDKTEAELLDCVNSGACGIYGGPVTNCNYYKVEGDKFCWKINNYYFRDITENRATLMARCFFGNATVIKTDCSFACAFWFHREKRTYKPNSTITYSQVTKENYCADTLATLYQGRQIIRKDDADSLIVIQFSNNGINW